MEVVNVRCKNIRPQYDNLKEWCEDKNNVYIGRKGIVFIVENGVRTRYPSKNSIWANPFKDTEENREKCIMKFKKYIVKKIEDEDLVNELLELQDKTLGCWCDPKPCHGHVLQELIEFYSK